MRQGRVLQGVSPGLSPLAMLAQNSHFFAGQVLERPPGQSPEANCPRVKPYEPGPWRSEHGQDVLCGRKTFFIRVIHIGQVHFWFKRARFRERQTLETRHSGRAALSRQTAAERGTPCTEGAARPLFVDTADQGAWPTAGWSGCNCNTQDPCCSWLRA